MPHKKKSKDNLTPGQKLSAIRKSARSSAKRGNLCSSREELKRKRGYTEEQINLYLSEFARAKGTDEEQAIKHARTAGQALAKRSVVCLSDMELKSKGYSDIQIATFVDAFEKSKNTAEELEIKKVRHNAQVLACKGYPCPTVESLKAKGYNDAQIEAHHIAYEAAKGTDEEQPIKKARYDAQRKASHGSTCPTVAELKFKGYSDEQIQAYRTAYEAAKGTDEEQAIKKARHDAQMKASHGSTCPTVAELKIKGYSDEQIQAYRTAYEAAKGTDEEQAIRRARYNAKALARQGYACPTAEILKANGYSEIQIQAYQAAHKAFKDTHEMPAISTLEHRDFNHDGGVEFMSDDDSDEEAALLLFSSIQQSHTISTLASSTTSIEQDATKKTRRLH